MILKCIIKIRTYRVPRNLEPTYYHATGVPTAAAAYCSGGFRVKKDSILCSGDVTQGSTKFCAAWFKNYRFMIFQLSAVSLLIGSDRKLSRKAADNNGIQSSCSRIVVVLIS